MEDKTFSQRAGKAPSSSPFELEKPLRNWKHPRHTVSVTAETSTVHQSPSESNQFSLVFDSDNTKAGKDDETAKQLLDEIATDMRQNAHDRESILKRRRASREQDGTAPGDPDAWQREFDGLVESGIQDVNIGYWRCSTAIQTEREGVPSQKHSVIGHSVLHSDRGVDMWVWDVDPGKLETRVGLDFLQKAMATGHVARITVQRLDRFARNNYLAESLHRVASEHQVALVSATESIPEGPIGIMFRQILQALAQYESSLIASRLSGGKRMKRKRLGAYSGGPAPYGYTSVGKGGLIICKPEARVVQLIFMLFSKGYSQMAIAAALNRWGIPTRAGGHQGWRQGQIRRIILSEAAYRAEALFSQTEKDPDAIAHPPLLEHRCDPSERTYLYGNVVSKPRVPVPDDLNLSEMPAPSAPWHSYRTLTKMQALSLKTLYTLRDRGFSLRRIASELNSRGLTTVTGKAWKLRSVADYVDRRVLYEAAIAAAELSQTDLERVLNPAAHEQGAIDRMKVLRLDGMSLPNIKERLKADGFLTASGCEWSLSSIHRVLAGKNRQATRGG